jgi:hypothetical protein
LPLHEKAKVDEGWGMNRPFRPLVPTVADARMPESFSAGLVDLMSMFCVSRPATLLAESPLPRVWFGDLCHLVILLAAPWAAAYALLLGQERIWPRLIGLG